MVSRVDITYEHVCMPAHACEACDRAGVDEDADGEAADGEAVDDEADGDTSFVAPDAADGGSDALQIVVAGPPVLEQTTSITHDAEKLRVFLEVRNPHAGIVLVENNLMHVRACVCVCVCVPG